MFTWFSRDAGWTWSMLRHGSHIYDITNHGSLVVLVDNMDATNTVRFTWNEGFTWNRCNISNPLYSINHIEAQGLTSDPQGLRPDFILYGRRRIGEGSRTINGVLINIDFSGLHERTCQGWDSPNDPDNGIINPNSDYEVWSPSDMRNDACLLGHRDVYVRRLPNKECLNPPEFNPTNHRTIKNCSCTREDYECDFCFVPATHQTSGEITCVMSMSQCPRFHPKIPPSDCEGTWLETKGYRLIPGDTCDISSGLNLLPIVQNCPPKSPSTITSPDNLTPNSEINSPSSNNNNGQMSPLVNAILMSIPFLGGILLVIGILYFCSARNQGVRSCVSRVLPDKYLPEFNPPVYNTYNYNANHPNILDEDLLQDDDTLQEDGRNFIILIFFIYLLFYYYFIIFIFIFIFYFFSINIRC